LFFPVGGFCGDEGIFHHDHCVRARRKGSACCDAGDLACFKGLWR
jgi:hypothetical protein